MIKVLALLKIPRLLLALSSIIILSNVVLPIFVYADPLPPSELQALNEYPLWAPNSCNGSGSGSGSSAASLSVTAATGKSAWTSTVQPPYYLEELVINILQDLAQTLNVPQSDTVTQQHVIAMIAWAQAEGGNLVVTDPNTFNIWNMGFMSNYPQLYVGSTGAGDGSSDSFVSFNAAVQAFAIEFTGSNQSRIGAILSNPSSTPEQIFQAIATPDSVSGNEVWATADPTKYINTMEGGLNSVEQNYATLAGVVIGPGQASTNHVPASELQFSGGSGSATTTDSTGTSATATGSSASSCSCSSSTSNATQAASSSSTGSTSGAPTIVLDPGHATKANENVDSTTDEPVFDYSNPVEQQQVWDMAQDLKTKLTAAGYNVLLTKSSEDDTSTNLKQRAEVGNQAHAALGVSLHTTPGSPTNGNDVFVPVVGEYLVKVSGQHDTYTNSSLATTDAGYGQTMSQTLGQATSLNFKTGGYSQIYGPITRQMDGVTMQGTMLVTQYFATVPWLYLERYQDIPSNAQVSSKGMSDYETGVLNGIEKIVPISSSASTTASNGGSSDSGSACPGTSSTTNCSQGTGDAEILCKAEQYQGIYYEWDGGHNGIKAFTAGCPDPSNPPDNKAHGGPINGDISGLSGNPSPCATDCSGLVSIAASEAFGADYTWSVSSGTGVMEGTDAQYWKSIPISQAQAGDIVTHPDHVEIVDHVTGNTVYSFGSHETGQETGPTSHPASYWSSGAWHWTGPGSTN